MTFHLQAAERITKTDGPAQIHEANSIRSKTFQPKKMNRSVLLNVLKCSYATLTCMFNDLIELGACEDVAEDVKLQKKIFKFVTKSGENANAATLSIKHPIS